MDGTLVDSTAVVEQVWGEFAGRYGLDIAEILRTSHGIQAADTVRRFAPAGADVVALTKELGAMERVQTAGIVAVPGAAALLRSLPAEAVALVTSADRILADIRMDAAGLSMPAAAVTAEMVTRGKPHPEGYLTAAGLLGGVGGRRCVRGCAGRNRSRGGRGHPDRGRRSQHGPAAGRRSPYTRLQRGHCRSGNGRGGQAGHFFPALRSVTTFAIRLARVSAVLASPSGST